LGSFYICWKWKTTLYIIQGQTTVDPTSIKSTTTNFIRYCKALITAV
jgi:hypothetical protein